MPTQGIYTIVTNLPIARDVYELALTGDTTALSRPGQFVNIQLNGLYLRRPISVCRREQGRMTLVYKVVGAGTRQMAGMRPGETLDLLVGLGNGFDVAPARGKSIALVGGGAGLPPLVGLMETLAGERVTCALGFASAEDVFYETLLRSLGADVAVCTMDGTAGMKGLVTDALKTMAYDYYFACGPKAMLKAVHGLGGDGQLSFEERMGCGFGACMGCTCQTLAGNKRVCLEGPVFFSGEVSCECFR
ncbi:MAG: dihydroorotate dehydrogenase electron transfer subunit [Firmicutes bacterium]|nr:dihydroorotate dehydrogenase electron transfer subunit [Bacillota bacterium]